jgi:preprotein translocase subunit SecG
MSGFLGAFLMILLLLTAVFLIVLVLIQRGKGGGLAGAFGGLGGQSAFGAKAGDVFTRVTIGVAAFWIVLCMIAVKLLAVSGGGPLKQMGNAPLQPPGQNAPAMPSKQPGPTTPTPGGASQGPSAPAKTPTK